MAMKGHMCKSKCITTLILTTLITLISGCDVVLQQKMISLNSDYSQQVQSITVNKTFNTQNQFILSTNKVGTNAILLDKDSFSRFSLIPTNLPTKKTVILFQDAVDSYSYNQVRFNLIPQPNHEMDVNISLYATLLSVELLDKGVVTKTYSIQDIKHGTI